MTETNSDGENPKIAGEAEAAKQSDANGQEQKKEAAPGAPLAPTVAVANDGSYIQVIIPTKMGHFGAVGFIHEGFLPWLRKFHQELKQKRQTIISPPQGFRGFNPFKRRN